MAETVDSRTMSDLNRFAVTLRRRRHLSIYTANSSTLVGEVLSVSHLANTTQSPWKRCGPGHWRSVRSRIVFEIFSMLQSATNV